MGNPSPEHSIGPVPFAPVYFVVLAGDRGCKAGTQESQFLSALMIRASEFRRGSPTATKGFQGLGIQGIF